MHLLTMKIWSSAKENVALEKCRELLLSLDRTALTSDFIQPDLQITGWEQRVSNNESEVNGEKGF